MVYGFKKSLKNLAYFKYIYIYIYIWLDEHRWINQRLEKNGGSYANSFNKNNEAIKRKKKKIKKLKKNYGQPIYCWQW